MRPCSRVLKSRLVVSDNNYRGEEDSLDWLCRGLVHLCVIWSCHFAGFDTGRLRIDPRLIGELRRSPRQRDPDEFLAGDPGGKRVGLRKCM